MSILDILKRKKNQTVFKELGEPGTQLFSGFLSEEFNYDLRDRPGILIFDKMRKSDAQVFASLNAIKYPLLAAKWFIESAKGKDVDEKLAAEQAQFIEDNLINKLRWKRQLKLILTYLDFGFKYLEKVFGTDEQGKVVWAKWGDRQQTAHYKWESDAGDKGVQQQLPNPEDAGDYQPFIPLQKLLLFSFNREGDNYAGVSLLRTAYKHWWFKDTLYKIQGISAERYGVGIPLIYTGDNSNADDKTRAENMGKNMRSNETSFIVAPGNPNSKDNPGWLIDILTPKGDAKAPAIAEAIDHHNRMIIMNVLAPFLDLGSGTSGSFALSKDQSDFFLLGLRSIADDIKEVVNNAIEELILINWPDTKIFPKLEVTEIAKPDMQEFSMALNSLTSAGLINIDEELLRFIRNTMKLPDMPEDAEIIKEKQEEKKPKEEDIEKEEQVKKEEDEKFKKKIKLAEIPMREKLFLKSIMENEEIIDDSLGKFEKELKETEKQLKTFLGNKIEKAGTKDLNGVIVIKSNLRLFNEIKSGVNDIMKKFKRRTSGGSLSREMMKRVAKTAIKATGDLDNTVSLAATFLIAEPQIKSFMSGHISNIDAVVFNEGRRILENVHDNITQQMSLRLTREQIGKIKFNRNIFQLSVTAHPRGLFRSIIAENAKGQGRKYFKMIVPPDKISKLSPSGITAGLIFLIMTAQQWDKKTGIKNSVNTVGGLGAHHGSYEYFYPIDEDLFEEEERLAQEQRNEFNDLIK